MNFAALPIFDAALLVAVAPLYGVYVGAKGFRGAVLAAASFGALLAVSAGLTLVSSGWAPERVLRAVESHATLAVVGLALAAFGAWCGSVFPDPLDAAAVGAGAAIVASVGLLASGPVAAELPAPILNAGLAASPIVATAAAAGIDILRTDWLYRVSPLAHGRFDYPTWYATLLSYGTVLSICGAGIARAKRTNRP